MLKSDSSRRNLAFSSTPPIRTLLVLAVVLLAVVPGLPLAAQDKPQGSGFDFLRTAPQGSSFSFSGDFSIPAGFFGDSYERFSGTVKLKGVPIGSFRNSKTGDADVIIERKTRLAPAAKYPSEQKTEIEIAALSLQSAAPIRVRVGKKTELWDVKVEQSPSHPSTGSINIKQSNARGGSADLELAVYPLFTFTRRGDKAEKKLDTGTLKLAGDAASQLTLRANNTPWATKSPRGALVVDGLSDNFFVGVKGGTIVATTARARIIIHIIIIARPNVAAGPGPAQ
jgi:hypothetical protein